MKNNFLKTLKYIYWARESEYMLLTEEEFYRKINYYKSNGTNMQEIKKCDRFAWINAKNPYRTDIKMGKYEQLYTYENGKYYRYSYNLFSSNKVVNPGRDAYNAVVEKLKEKYNLNREGMSNAFGTVPEEYKICIPKQFYHINERFTKRITFGLSGADYSSHYPANICGKLPTSRGCKVCSGTVKPTEEYPFAFYLKSGHYAEYNNFDTHEWLDSDLAFRLFEHKKSYDWDLSVKAEDDQTVLMQASEYELTDIIKYFYELRKSDPIAKLVMNAFIGYLHKENNYEHTPYAHLAAVCLARSNNSMLKSAEKIGFNKIVQICVDGIIYIGEKKIAGKEKKLGELNQEFTNCYGRIDGTNRYIIKDNNNNIVKYKMQGCNFIGDKSIEAGYIPKFEDMDNWRRVIGGKEDGREEV